MAQRIEFRLDSSDYSELGSKALSRGEVEKAIGYFKTACGIADDSASYTALGCAYAEIHALELSNAVLYTAMTKAKTEDDETPALWQLCSNALEEGDAEAAAYYLRYLGEDGQRGARGGGRQGNPAVPHGEEACGRVLRNAAVLRQRSACRQRSRRRAPLRQGDGRRSRTLQEHRTEDRSSVPFCQGRFRQSGRACGGDGKEGSFPDNKATLATAYSVQERDAEADAILDDIMSAEKLGVEIALKVLPLLVARERDADVLRAAEAVSGAAHFKQFSEMYRSEALYNTGKRKEAMRVMGSLGNIYGQYSPAGYYMKLYRTEPERVPYGHEWPHAATIEYVNKVKSVCETEDVGKIRDALAYDADFNEALRWILWYGPDFIACPTLMCLSRVRKRTVEKLFRERLIGNSLSFDAMTIILDYLLGGGISMEFDIVTQNRFKPVDFILPRTFHALPKHLRRAVYRSACDIVYTDEDPSTYLERLATVVNEMTAVDAEGELVWKCKNGRKIGMLRSEETMVGVLLGRVYFDDPDPDEDAMERYGLNERTYYKYKKIFFGDDESYED